MGPPDATSIAALLCEFGQRSALRGGNPFRAKAYARAADNLLALSLPLDEVIVQDRLREIPGVGAAIADIIKKVHATGTHPTLETMRKEIPAGVLEMLAVPGLRPDKVLKIYRELGLTSLAQLESAVREGRLQKVKGLGAALQTKILRGIAMQREARGKRHLHRAAELLQSTERHLREAWPDIIRITPAGDFRRGCELTSDLSLVAEVPRLPGGPELITAGGELKAHLTDPAHFGITLLLATGSDAHLMSLRSVAAERNMILGKAGLRRGKKVIAAATEDDIYAALGLQPVPPELREGRDEICRALTGTLPRLVTDHDIAGIQHAHTDRSDGVDTLETMAEATLGPGLSVFWGRGPFKVSALCGWVDRRRGLRAAGRSRSPEQKVWQGFSNLQGYRVRHLPDGAPDYPIDVLETFDFVVASVHGRFKMGRQEQTDRIIRAVSNPYTTILGHMTGRQLLRRAGYEIDIEKVLAACAKHGVAVEINANPWRLDLDWRWHETALRLGCMMSINPDAHSTREIDLTHWGVEMARAACRKSAF